MPKALGESSVLNYRLNVGSTSAKLDARFNANAEERSSKSLWAAPLGFELSHHDSEVSSLC